MLALVNAEGLVDTTIPGLANIANVSIEKTREAIAKFEGPDPDSRTTDHDGRRIAKVENGWFLLNHQKYRKIRDPEERKEYMRKYMKEYRKQNVNNINSGKLQLAHTEAEAEAEAINKEYMSIFDEARKLYGGTKRGNETEFYNFTRKHKDWCEVLPLLKPAIEAQISWRQNVTDFRPPWKNFSTWVNNRCWEDELQHKETAVEQIKRLREAGQI